MVEAGGLHIVGTERHESRRIDNQLRGRSGRQGDPGSSRFYLSLEDPLLRIFAGERARRRSWSGSRCPRASRSSIRWSTARSRSAQRKVEARNFDIRKQLLEYDDVANDQRKVIYQQRNELLESERRRARRSTSMRDGVVDRHRPRATCRRRASRSSGTSPGLETTLAGRLPAAARRSRSGSRTSRDLDDEALRERIVEAARRSTTRQGWRRSAPDAHAPVRAQHHAADARPALARAPRRARPPAPGHPPARLRAEESEAGVQARGVRAVLRHARPRSSSEVTKILHDACRCAAQQDRVRRSSEAARRSERAVPARRLRGGAGERRREAEADAAVATRREAAAVRARRQKVGRNDPCPCGSGKKYKQCHGKLLTRELAAAPRTARPGCLGSRRCPSISTPPDPRRSLPVAGVELGVARGRNPQARRPQGPAADAARDRAARVAGVFTQNRFCAAPVTVCREHLLAARPARRSARWSSTPATRTPAPARRASRDARATCAAVARAARLRAGAGAAVLDRRDHGAAAGRAHRGGAAALPRRRCAPDDWLAAAAGDHDDRHRAEGARRAASTIDGAPVTVTGIAKGAGHDPARTWRRCSAFIATDARDRAAAARRRWSREAADASFNCITVDGDTSTNDRFVLIATGAAAHRARSTRRAEPRLRRARATRSTRSRVELAQAIVRDGEGATKFITVRVEGGRSGRRVPRASRYAIAHSPLVKTAFFASDPNLGRILVRDRQRRHRRPRRRAGRPLARRRAGRRARRPRRRLPRGGRPARDEAGRDHGARRARPRRRRASDRLDLRSLARLRDHQRRLPHLSRAGWRSRRSCIDARSTSAARPRRARCCRRRAPPTRLEARRSPFAGASATAAGDLAAGRASARDRARRPARHRRAEARWSSRTRGSSSPGCPANNVLLTGARGTGKSSLIKALLNEYAPQGPAPDRGRQARPGRPARHRRAGRRRGRSASSSSATTCRSRPARPATRR